ncbi:MAG: PQQ-binding-like beta-propeller repeat protein [Planctomycetota bacterium]
MSKLRLSALIVAILLAAWIGVVMTRSEPVLPTPRSTLPTHQPPTASLPATVAPCERVDWPSYRGSPALAGTARSLPGIPVRKWSWEAGASVIATAAIVGDGVFVATQRGVLARLRLRDGHEMWRLPGGAPYVGSPLVVDGTVYVGDEDGVVRAVDAASGALRWSRDLEAKIMGSPTAAPTSILIGTYGNVLLRLAVNDGHTLWSVNSDSYVHATAAVVGDWVVFAGCDADVHCLDMSDGSQRGHYPGKDPYAAAPACVGNTAWVASHSGTVAALTLPAVTVRWHKPGGIGEITEAAAADGIHAVFAGGAGALVCLAARDGALRWTVRLGTGVRAPPVICGDQVIQGAEDGVLRGLDLSDGKERWRFAAGGAIRAGAAIAGPWLIIPTTDGAVHGLCAESTSSGP